MANINYIDFYSSIGDSLSTINNNFVQLDTGLKDIEVELASHIEKVSRFIDTSINTTNKPLPSVPNIILDPEDSPLLVTNLASEHAAVNYIENLVITQDIINNNINSLVKIADNINVEKGAWEQATTIVAANSARWLHPITLLYPCIIEEPLYRATNKIRDEVSEWLNNYFPVITLTGTVNYVENQFAYVYITYRLNNVHPNNTDVTVHNNIQTLKFAVKNCRWLIEDYIIGDQIAPWPTPAPTVTPTYTPTNTPPNTVTPTSTPGATPTPTSTPTPTFVDYFLMQILGMNGDTSKPAAVEGNGELQLNFMCPLHSADTWYSIVVGSRYYTAQDKVVMAITDLKKGRYLFSVRAIAPELGGAMEKTIQGEIAVSKVTVKVFVDIDTLVPPTRKEVLLYGVFQSNTRIPITPPPI